MSAYTVRKVEEWRIYHIHMGSLGSRVYTGTTHTAHHRHTHTTHKNTCTHKAVDNTQLAAREWKINLPVPVFALVLRAGYENKGLGLLSLPLSVC